MVECYCCGKDLDWDNFFCYFYIHTGEVDLCIDCLSKVEEELPNGWSKNDEDTKKTILYDALNKVREGIEKNGWSY